MPTEKRADRKPSSGNTAARAATASSEAKKTSRRDSTPILITSPDKKVINSRKTEHVGDRVDSENAVGLATSNISVDLPEVARDEAKSVIEKRENAPEHDPSAVKTPAKKKNRKKMVHVTKGDLDKLHKNDKTADDVIKGFRDYQFEITRAAERALTVFAGIEEASYSSMKQGEQDQLRKDFYGNVAEVNRHLDRLIKYRSKTLKIADDDSVEYRGSMLPDKRSPEPDKGTRLIFKEPPDVSRARLLANHQSAIGLNGKSDFTTLALRALLDAALDLVGAERKAADAMIDAFIDPAAAANPEHDDPFYALASLKTKVGIYVFLPGSMLQQTHRVMGEELFATLTELERGRKGLEEALTLAGRTRGEKQPTEANESETEETQKNKKKVAAVRARAPTKPRQPRERKTAAKKLVEQGQGQQGGVEDGEDGKNVKKTQVGSHSARLSGPAAGMPQPWQY
jgi:hypothetical protein